MVPGKEPPLQGYWTHKINLPYPPAHHKHHHHYYQRYLQQQLVGAGTSTQSALPPYIHSITQPYMTPIMMQPIMSPAMPPVMPPVMPPIMQPIIPYILPTQTNNPIKNRMSRNDWRSKKKNEKYWQRREMKEKNNEK